MDTATKQAFIRSCTQGSAIAVRWSQHAIAKLIVENLTRTSVELALSSSEIIEDYPTTHRPLPDCLVLAKIAADAIHAVVAIDQSSSRIFIITVYRPDPRRWMNDYRTRITQ